jgi:hypothetical protein
MGLAVDPRSMPKADDGTASLLTPLIGPKSNYGNVQTCNLVCDGTHERLCHKRGSGENLQRVQVSNSAELIKTDN